MNNSSLVVALQPPLPQFPSKNPYLPPLHVPTPVPKIAAASVVTISDAFLDLSTKVQLNIILNRK